MHDENESLSKASPPALGGVLSVPWRQQLTGGRLMRVRGSIFCHNLTLETRNRTQNIIVLGDNPDNVLVVASAVI